MKKLKGKLFFLYTIFFNGLGQWNSVYKNDVLVIHDQEGVKYILVFHIVYNVVKFTFAPAANVKFSQRKKLVDQHLK